MWNVPSDNSVVLGLAQVHGPVRPPILTVDGSVFSRLCGGEPLFFPRLRAEPQRAPR
jgi:hypothetical protein